MAYPELVSGGVSKSHKCKGLVKVGAGKGVIRVDLKKHGRGGVSEQPENPPGYATVVHGCHFCYGSLLQASDDWLTFKTISLDNKRDTVTLSLYVWKGWQCVNIYH